jgi:hypothetical protein
MYIPFMHVLLIGIPHEKSEGAEERFYSAAIFLDSGP